MVCLLAMFYFWKARQDGERRFLPFCFWQVLRVWFCCGRFAWNSVGCWTAGNNFPLEVFLSVSFWGFLCVSPYWWKKPFQHDRWIPGQQAKSFYEEAEFFWNFEFAIGDGLLPFVGQHVNRFYFLFRILSRRLWYRWKTKQYHWGEWLCKTCWGCIFKKCEYPQIIWHCLFCSLSRGFIWKCRFLQKSCTVREFFYLREIVSISSPTALYCGMKLFVEEGMTWDCRGVVSGQKNLP